MLSFTRAYWAAGSSLSTSGFQPLDDIPNNAVSCFCDPKLDVHGFSSRDRLDLGTTLLRSLSRSEPHCISPSL